MTLDILKPSINDVITFTLTQKLNATSCCLSFMEPLNLYDIINGHIYLSNSLTDVLEQTMSCMFTLVRVNYPVTVQIPDFDVSIC